MGLEIFGGAGAAAWLAGGAVLGGAAVLLWQRLRQWREARAAEEWDPY